MEKSAEEFREVLEGKRLPPLTLDNKWHVLIEKMGAQSEVQALSDELNDLIKQQGGADDEIKRLKKVKKNLMNEIVTLADQAGEGDKKAEKKLEEYRAAIEESNNRIENQEDILMELPREIDRVNKQLMQMTMQISYERLKDNKRETEEAMKWIRAMRIELKKRLVRKQEKEQMSQDIYTFMHQIFGPEVVDIFDLQYLPDEEKKPASDDQKSSEDGKKKGNA